MAWDSDLGVTRGKWPDCKNSGTKESLFLSDREFYELDQHWLLFVHYMCDLNPPNAQCSSNDDWLFQDLHRMEESNKSAAASAITKTITKMMPTAENIAKGKIVCNDLYDRNISSVSLRRGATLQMSFHCHMQDVASKTGHYFFGKDVSTIWEYFELNDISLLKATKALSGFGIDHQVIPPSLDIIRRLSMPGDPSASMDNLVSNWLMSLLDGMYRVTSSPSLSGSIDCWLATILMYLPQFYVDCQSEYCPSREHYIITCFKEKSQGFVTFPQCLEFAEMIRGNFESANCLSLSVGTEDIGSRIKHMVVQNARLTTQVERLQRHGDIQSAQIQEMHGQMREMATSLQAATRALTEQSLLLKRIASSSCQNREVMDEIDSSPKRQGLSNQSGTLLQRASADVTEVETISNIQTPHTLTWNNVVEIDKLIGMQIRTFVRMVYDRKLFTTKVGKKYHDSNFQVKKKDSSLLRRVRLAILLIRDIVSTNEYSGRLTLSLEAPDLGPSANRSTFASAKKAKDDAVVEVEGLFKKKVELIVSSYESASSKKLSSKGAMPHDNCISAWICRYEKTIKEESK